MIELTKINEMIQYIEKGIEDRFGSQALYQNVKDVLEGKAEAINTRELVRNSCGFFSGENKPHLLLANIIKNLNELFDARSKSISKGIKEQERYIANGIEKNSALMENRASKITYDIDNGEALFTGRLISSDGLNPVAGAKVFIRGAGKTASKVIATAQTDANGEYVIKLDEEAVKEAPKNVKINFNTPKEEIIAESADLSLTKGKVKSVNVNVAEDKQEIASELIQDIEERKRIAMLEVAEVKKNEAELNLLRFQTERSANTIKTRLDNIKALFMGKTS